MEDNKYNKNTTNEETNSLNVDSIEVEKKSDNIKKNETNIEKEKNENEAWIVLVVALFILLAMTNILWAYAYSNKKIENIVTYADSNTINSSELENIKEYGYDFTVFDSNGDGEDDGIAKLTCTDIFGGYGSFRMEVFALGDKTYSKAFDSMQYTIDEVAYQKLSESIDGELMIDSVCSVEAVDTDGDGAEELVLRHYAWIENHTNHVGDVVSTLKVIDGEAKIIEQRLDLPK